MNKKPIKTEYFNKLLFKYISYISTEIHYINISKPDDKTFNYYIHFEDNINIHIDIMKLYYRLLIYLDNDYNQYIIYNDRIDEENTIFNTLNKYVESKVISYVKIRENDERGDFLFNPRYIFSKNDDKQIENSLSLLYCNNPVTKIKVPTPHDIDSYLDRFIKSLIDNEQQQQQEQEQQQERNKEEFNYINYDHFFSYGNFDEIVFNEENKDFGNKMTKVIKNLSDNKNVFIIGYGASGAGKTTTLIYDKSDASKTDKDGSIIHMIKKIRKDREFRKTFKELKLIITEIFMDTNSNKIISLPKFNDIFKYEDEDDNFYYTYYNDSYNVKEELKNFSFKTDMFDSLYYNFVEKKKYKLSEVLQELIDNNRLTEATTNNITSSRSHIIASITLNLSDSIKPILFVGDFAGVENTFDYSEYLNFHTEDNLKKLINKIYDSYKNIESEEVEKLFIKDTIKEFYDIKKDTGKETIYEEKFKKIQEKFNFKENFIKMNKLIEYFNEEQFDKKLIEQEIDFSTYFIKNSKITDLETTIQTLNKNVTDLDGEIKNLEKGKPKTTKDGGVINEYEFNPSNDQFYNVLKNNEEIKNNKIKYNDFNIAIFNYLFRKIKFKLKVGAIQKGNETKTGIKYEPEFIDVKALFSQDSTYKELKNIRYKITIIKNKQNTENIKVTIINEDIIQTILSTLYTALKKGFLLVNTASHVVPIRTLEREQVMKENSEFILINNKGAPEKINLTKKEDINSIETLIKNELKEKSITESYITKFFNSLIQNDFKDYGDIDEQINTKRTEKKGKTKLITTKKEELETLTEREKRNINNTLYLLKKIIFMTYEILKRNYEGYFINKSLEVMRNTMTKVLQINNQNIVPNFYSKCRNYYNNYLFNEFFENKSDENLDENTDENYFNIIHNIIYYIITDPNPVKKFESQPLSINNIAPYFNDTNLTYCICLVINNSYSDIINLVQNPPKIPYIDITEGYIELNRFKKRHRLLNEINPEYIVFKDKFEDEEEDIIIDDLKNKISSTIGYNYDDYISKKLHLKIFKNIHNYLLYCYRYSSSESNEYNIMTNGNKSISERKIDHINKLYNDLEEKHESFYTSFSVVIEAANPNFMNRSTSDSNTAIFKINELLKSIEKYLESIEIMNSTSVIGTINFTDEISKYNLNYNSCSISQINIKNKTNINNLFSENYNFLKVYSLDRPSDNIANSNKILYDRKIMIKKHHENILIKYIIPNILKLNLNINMYSSLIYNKLNLDKSYIDNPDINDDEKCFYKEYSRKIYKIEISSYKKNNYYNIIDEFNNGGNIIDFNNYSEENEKHINNIYDNIKNEEIIKEEKKDVKDVKDRLFEIIKTYVQLKMLSKKFINIGGINILNKKLNKKKIKKIKKININNKKITNKRNKKFYNKIFKNSLKKRIKK